MVNSLKKINIFYLKQPKAANPIIPNKEQLFYIIKLKIIKNTNALLKPCSN